MNAAKFKYRRGDKVALCNLVDNPEMNGLKTTIVGLRPVILNDDCPSGCSYYLADPKLPLDWYCEERLQLCSG